MRSFFNNCCRLFIVYDLLHLNTKNRVGVLASIKLRTPMVRNIVFRNAFSYSSALVIASKLIHNFGSLYAVFTLATDSLEQIVQNVNRTNSSKL